jgi:hypothetical protein
MCLAELQSLEYNDCRLQAKLKAAQALLAAVDNSNDAIEIADENNQIQVSRVFSFQVSVSGFWQPMPFLCSQCRLCISFVLILIC